MKARIERLSTSDGYLRNAAIELAEGLTCIIGARGTCKSTVVETIRFAYDLDPARIESLIDDGSRAAPTRPTRGLLNETLAGGTAVCSTRIVDDHGTSSELRLERSIATTKPRAYRDGILDPTFSTHDAPIEIYSQGDLLEIAANPEHRLQLIDRPHSRAISEIHTRLRDAHGRIESLGREIFSLREGIREDRRGLVPSSDLERQLEEIVEGRPMLDPRLEQERDEYEQRRRLLARARGCCDSLSLLFPSRLPDGPRDEVLLELIDALRAAGMPPAAELAELLRRLSDAAVLLERRLAESRALADRARGSLEALDQAFEEHDERYRTLRRDQEALSASLEHEDRVRAQMRRMAELAEDIDRRSTKLDALIERRSEARRDAEACLDELFALRLAEVDAIGANLGSDISLEIVQGAQSGTYVDRLASLLQGTRLKRQREIASRIADLITPAELVDIVEHTQTGTLAELAGLDESQASRIINHFLDNMLEVLELETIVFEDQLEISMSVEGQMKPIEQLSRGQMATALLPLILRPADFPLVFDQPEDDLDNRFIFDELVSRI